MSLTDINTRVVSTGLLHNVPSKLRATVQHLHCSHVTLQSCKPEPTYSGLNNFKRYHESEESSMGNG